MFSGISKIFLSSILDEVENCYRKLKRNKECSKKIQKIVKDDEENEEDEKCATCVCILFVEFFELKVEEYPLIEDLFCSPGNLTH